MNTKDVGFILANYTTYDTIEKLTEVLKPLPATPEMLLKWHETTPEAQRQRVVWLHQSMPPRLCCGRQLPKAPAPAPPKANP